MLELLNGLTVGLPPGDPLYVRRMVAQGLTVPTRTTQTTRVLAQGILRVWDAPHAGPPTLLAGDSSLGYYGTIGSGAFVDGLSLAQAIGLSAGTSDDLNQSPDWFKCAYQGEIIYIPKTPLRAAISWDNIYSAGACGSTVKSGSFGSTVAQDATVVIGGSTYEVRLLKSGAVAYASGGDVNISEMSVGDYGETEHIFTKLVGVHPDGNQWGEFDPVDLKVGHSGNNYATGTWLMELPSSNSTDAGILSSDGTPTSMKIPFRSSADSAAYRAWRPVLVYIPE